MKSSSTLPSSKENSVHLSKLAKGDSRDFEIVFNNVLDSVVEVYFSLRGENKKKLLETIQQLKKLRESINLAH